MTTYGGLFSRSGEAVPRSERQPLFLGNWLLFWFFSDSWKSVFFLFFCMLSFFKTCLFNSGWEALVQLWQFVQQYEGSGVDSPSVGAIERIKRRRLLPSTSVSTLVDEEHPRSFVSPRVSGWVSQPPHLVAN